MNLSFLNRPSRFGRISVPLSTCRLYFLGKIRRDPLQISKLAKWEPQFRTISHRRDLEVLPPHTLELSCDKIGSPWEKPHAHRRQWRVHNPTLTLYNSQRSLGRWGTDINMFARFLTVLAIALLIEQSANAAEKGWMLRQSTIGTGDTEAYLTPTCFKMIYLVSGLTIVATAPRWKAQIFNPRKQARFTETLPDLGREIRSIVAFTNQDISPTSFQKDKTAVVLGHKALRYKFEVNVGTTGLHKGETWFATDMPIFKDLAEYGATVCM